MINNLLLIFIPIITAIIILLIKDKKVNYLFFIAQMALFYFALKIIPCRGYVISNYSKYIGIELKVCDLAYYLIFITIFLFTIAVLFEYKNKFKEIYFVHVILLLEGCLLASYQLNDFFSIFLLLEVVTILSTILVIYEKNKEALRDGFYYILFNSLGMVFYISGIIILYQIFGTLNMDIISYRMSEAKMSSPYYLNASFVLISLSISLKAAFFPLYNWLPRAHSSAPKVVSALLSGLLINIGPYYFMKIYNVYDEYQYLYLFKYMGALTLILAGVMAFSQTKIKRVLAFSTISQMGLIIYLFSTLDSKQVSLTVALINHSLIKFLLFISTLYELPFYFGLVMLSGIPLSSMYVTKSMGGISLQSYFFTFLTMTYIIKAFQMQRKDITDRKKLLKMNKKMYKKLNRCKDDSLRAKFNSQNIVFFILTMTILGVTLYEYFNLELKIKLFDFLIYPILIVLAFYVQKFSRHKIFKYLKNVNPSFKDAIFMLLFFLSMMVISIKP
ncbi:MAG: proton-conducting transporter membrane subunit [Peptostreptococcaceae bacterium]|jgi:multicomponent Na+:H+ antiporter subunit D|nr:proton-conducting transporter membrane subunit [Peptostreptococcaceae bacterium]